VRITTDRPAPAVGQSAAGECRVECLKAGGVVGREVASVIGPADIASVAKGPAPTPPGIQHGIPAVMPGALADVGVRSLLN
jgi:hypothetical protein